MEQLRLGRPPTERLHLNIETNSRGIQLRFVRALYGVKEGEVTYYYDLIRDEAIDVIADEMDQR